MKENKENIYRKIYNYLEKKYQAPEECKLIMAERNLTTMFKAQIMLIIIGFFGLISLLILNKGHYLESIPRFIYFGEYVVFGFVCIIASAKLKKMNFVRSFIKMLPTYFLFLYLMVYPMFILFYEKNTFSAMVVYACVAVNFPIFFDISPAVFTPIITVASVALMTRITKEYSFFISMDSVIFVLILYFLSFKRWANEKDNYLHHRSEHEYKENIENELQLAQIVQQGFFKHNETIYDDWAISYYNKPMAGVSGDFLDIYSNGNILNGIGIFDVSGHGISSGLVTMLVKNIIHQEFYTKDKMDLWEILNNINGRVIQEKGDIENYLTGILIRTNKENLEIAIAGHPRPIFYHHRTGICEFLQMNKESVGAIGIPGFPVYYTSQVYKFEEGDELFIYSDGLVDTVNERKEDFGKDRLLNLIYRVCEMPAKMQMIEIEKQIAMFQGRAPQKDDLTFMILKK